jgi:hypothetical protein
MRKNQIRIQLKEKFPEKLASYMVPRLNLKDLSRGIGKEEDGIRLKNLNGLSTEKMITGRGGLSKLVHPTEAMFL